MQCDYCEISEKTEEVIEVKATTAFGGSPIALPEKGGGQGKEAFLFQES